jgi:[ribosomal protein S5]-alanine N-acetyltransferase
MHLPILSTGDLVLRPIEDRDTAALFHHFSDDTVTKYMDIDSFSNISEATHIIDLFRKSQEEEEGTRWAVTLAGNDELIGTCGYHKINKPHFKAEIGYDLRPAYWGKGIMKEAISCMLTYGYEELQFNRIEAFVDPENIASSKLLTRLGFRYEGLLRDAFFEKGKFVDAELYSLLRHEHTRESIY